jgi:hypothetical protein
VVEQDHRRVKQRIGPMLGFKRFDMAATTIRGIELPEKIKKAQFQIGKRAYQLRHSARSLGGTPRLITDTKPESTTALSMPTTNCTRTL